MRALSPTLVILKRGSPKHQVGKALSSSLASCNLAATRSIQEHPAARPHNREGAPLVCSPFRRHTVAINPCRDFSSSVTATSDSSSGSSITTSSDGVVGTPIDFDIAARVEGNESQIVTIELTAGQVLRAESGALMYMTEGVEMETSTGGGLAKAFSRMMTGQNLFLTDYRYTKEDGGSGLVALGTDFPSKIVRLSVPQYGGKLVCQKGALLCASHTIDIQMEYSKNLTSGFFGGEGFILQVRCVERY